MKSQYSKLLILVIVVSLFLTNCKKGDPGAQGPAGQNGAAGPAGAQGPTGAKGDTGVANVYYSAWLTVPFLPDTIHNGNSIDTIGYYSNITAAKLDTNILFRGEMKVYVNLGTSANPVINVLPYFDAYSGINITPTFLLEKINIYSNADVSTVTQNGMKYLQYRYIFIPGSNMVLRKIIDFNNYNEVKKYYGLKD